MIPHWLKKYLLLALAASAAAAIFLKKPWWAAAAVLTTVAWLLVENARRTRFRFLAGNPSGKAMAEWHRDLGAKILALNFSPDGKRVAVSLEGGKILVLSLLGDLLQTWQGAPPQAVLPLDEGGLILAEDERLVLIGEDGSERRALAFEAPEFRQSYRLLYAGGDSPLYLHTPWFVQAFDSQLQASKARLGFQQVGNYMKYGVLAPGGDAVFVGGALLLEEDAGIQARWSHWKLNEDAFERVWLREDDGPANSHLRGLEWTAEADALVAERFRDGYDILIYNADGSERWTRPGGEHPRLSRNAEWIAWHNPFEGLTVSALPGGDKLWAKEFKEKIRLARPWNNGHCLVLEGRHLMVFDRKGEIRSDDWFQTDPFLVELAPSHRHLVVARQGQIGVIDLEGVQ